jgi:hypothetical protein
MLRLKNVLLINAISSGASGLALIVFASAIADIFGVTAPTAITEVGIFLLVFGLFVLREGQRATPNSNAVKVIITLDVTWVIASTLIVILQLFKLTPLGYITIVAVALWVAVMAYLQRVGLKETTSAKS